MIDVGERRRFFVGPTRRAVQVRDRECDNASCHDPVTNADIDHILEYSNDGLTVQANGRVLCKWHHRWRHKTDRQPPPAAKRSGGRTDPEQQTIEQPKQPRDTSWRMFASHRASLRKRSPRAIGW